MKNIVILGAGTGGTIVANMLSHKLNLKEWRITVIDKADTHLYQPGLLFIPLRLYGYADTGDVTKSIQDPLPSNITLVRADIKSIDHQNKTVETENGKVGYDWLVCALGCRIAPEEIEGLEDAWGKGVHSFYTLDSALEFQKALDNMREGRLVIDIAEMPIKCPVAPIEFAFLADYYFHLKGIRDRIDITLVTPFSGAFTKPVANRVLSEIAAEKRINIVPNFSLASIDAGKKTMKAYEGTTLEYDLACVIPPNLGPDAIEDSGLGDGTGYALTVPRTLKSRKADCIYFLGDNTNVSTSKAGSVTHFEAETVVENLLREIDGEKPLPSFDGHANCFIESGFHKALLIDFNYDVEPLTGSFPLPYVGPFSLLKETHINHMGKITFKWIYWDMLLPGYLPKVPLLPSHMNFVGKDLMTTPQVRHSKEMRVKDVMSKDVVTVKRGTSLAEAAKMLMEHRVSGLPVVDVDDKLIGVLTDADFIAAMDMSGDPVIKSMLDRIIRKNRPKKRMGTIVDDLMTKDPVTAREDDTLQRAIELMDKNQVKRLVITDTQNQVIGVVSRPDLMKLFTMK
ncbi:MAG: CBS domain-containing protein [Gammaproteobacteria bacterium]|nr:CBS domain-containing protein [Gammaproteobacteria bacterium]